MTYFLDPRLVAERRDSRGVTSGEITRFFSKRNKIKKITTRQIPTEITTRFFLKIVVSDLEIQETCEQKQNNFSSNFLCFYKFKLFCVWAFFILKELFQSHFFFEPYFNPSPWDPEEWEGEWFLNRSYFVHEVPKSRKSTKCAKCAKSAKSAKKATVC